VPDIEDQAAWIASYRAMVEARVRGKGVTLTIENEGAFKSGESVSMSRSSSEGPPPDAYWRVTNPERFRLLHDFALTLLTQLHSSFNVRRVEGYGV
jgi:hypothetical protein